MVAPYLQLNACIKMKDSRDNKIRYKINSLYSALGGVFFLIKSPMSKAEYSHSVDLLLVSLLT